MSKSTTVNIVDVAKFLSEKGYFVQTVNPTVIGSLDGEPLEIFFEKKKVGTIAFRESEWLLNGDYSFKHLSPLGRSLSSEFNVKVVIIAKMTT